MAGGAAIFAPMLRPYAAGGGGGGGLSAVSSAAADTPKSDVSRTDSSDPRPSPALEAAAIKPPPAKAPATPRVGAAATPAAPAPPVPVPARAYAPPAAAQAGRPPVAALPVAPPRTPQAAAAAAPPRAGMMAAAAGAVTPAAGGDRRAAGRPASAAAAGQQGGMIGQQPFLLLRPVAPAGVGAALAGGRVAAGLGGGVLPPQQALVAVGVAVPVTGGGGPVDARRLPLPLSAAPLRAPAALTPVAAAPVAVEWHGAAAAGLPRASAPVGRVARVSASGSPGFDGPPPAKPPAAAVAAAAAVPDARIPRRDGLPPEPALEGGGGARGGGRVPQSAFPPPAGRDAPAPPPAAAAAGRPPLHAHAVGLPRLEPSSGGGVIMAAAAPLAIPTLPSDDPRLCPPPHRRSPSPCPAPEQQQRHHHQEVRARAAYGSPVKAPLLLPCGVIGVQHGQAVGVAAAAGGAGPHTGVDNNHAAGLGPPPGTCATPGCRPAAAAGAAAAWAPPSPLPVQHPHPTTGAAPLPEQTPLTPREEAHPRPSRHQLLLQQQQQPVPLAQPQAPAAAAAAAAGVGRVPPPFEPRLGTDAATSAPVARAEANAAGVSGPPQHELQTPARPHQAHPMPPASSPFVDASLWQQQEAPRAHPPHYLPHHERVGIAGPVSAATPAPPPAAAPTATPPVVMDLPGGVVVRALARAPATPSPPERHLPSRGGRPPGQPSQQHHPAAAAAEGQCQWVVDPPLPPQPPRTPLPAAVGGGGALRLPSQAGGHPAPSGRASLPTDLPPPPLAPAAEAARQRMRAISLLRDPAFHVDPPARG